MVARRAWIVIAFGVTDRAKRAAARCDAGSRSPDLDELERLATSRHDLGSGCVVTWRCECRLRVQHEEDTDRSRSITRTRRSTSTWITSNATPARIAFLPKF